MAKVLLLFISVLTLHIIEINTAKDYGYFDYKLNSIVNCPGPKRKDCCNNKFTAKDNSLLVMDMDCTENVSPTKGKVVAFKNGQKVRLQMDKPCNHVFIRPIIISSFNASESCVISKHKYQVILDLPSIAQKYYGGMFFYGNWTFETSFHDDTKTCNILCMNINISLQPKASETKQ